MMKSSIFALALACGLLSSCNRFAVVEKYAAASSVTLKDTTVSEGYTRTVKRYHDYLGDLDQPAEDTSATKDMADLQAAYAKYFDSIGALAAGNEADYKAKWTDFSAALKGAKLASEGRSNMIGAVANAVSSIATTIARQKELSAAVKQANPGLQRNMQRLIGVTKRLEKTLDKEWKNADRQYAGKAHTDSNARLQRVEYLAKVDADKAGAEKFEEALTAVAAGHQKLTEDAEHLSLKDVQAAIESQKDAITAAYKAIHP